jgi:hypothetical protein
MIICKHLVTFFPVDFDFLQVMELFNWRATFDTSLAALRLFGLWPQEDFYNLHLYFISIKFFIFIQLFNLFVIEMNLESLALEMIAIRNTYGFVRNVLKELVGTLNEDVFPRTQTGFAKSVLGIWRTSTGYGVAGLGCLVPLLEYHTVSLLFIIAANLYMGVLLTPFIKFKEVQYTILCEALRGYCHFEKEEVVRCV